MFYHPILKPNTTDPRNPINYHGIALQTVVLKVFCEVLNAGSLTGQRQTGFYYVNKMVLGLTIPVWIIFL